MATPSLRSLNKALDLLGRIVESGDVQSVSSLARQIDLPHATAYRIAATLERAGMLTRLRRGYYLPGPAFLRWIRHGNLHRVLQGVARPIIDGLARDTGCTAHLGVFEEGMVTYLIKSGRSGRTVFTREGTQLEAYCTGIGKVLLAALPDSAREEYLRTGPFVRLTPNTLTDRSALRDVFERVAMQGFATDNAEMDTDLFCLAVPLRDENSAVIAAMSISTRLGKKDLRVHLDTLRSAASALGERLGPRVGADCG